MKQIDSNGLVSIIMLSCNNGQYVEESVRSVLSQTYKNWELVFLDDNSSDNTIRQILTLKEEAKLHTVDGKILDRIIVSQTISERGEGVNRVSAMKDAHGRWMAFLNVGDIWAPNKLENQIKYMEGNRYACTYTKYGSFDKKVIVDGPQRVTWKMMKKNCWPEYMTVMYDADKIGKVSKQFLFDNNDYALLLQLSSKADFYLLNECLAYTRYKPLSWLRYTPYKRFKWRFQVYRIVERMNPIVSIWMTCRNIFYGFVKKAKYVHKQQ